MSGKASSGGDLAPSLGGHQNHDPTFLFDKVMKDYVSTLWKLLIREKHIKSISIHLEMKCKYHKNLSSNSNHA